MYNRYKRGGRLSDDELYIRPSEIIEKERVRPERVRRESGISRNERKKQGLLGGLFGGKNPLGGLFKGLNISDWDTGDILLVLILIFLFLEGNEDNEELMIAIALVLFMGI